MITAKEAKEIYLKEFPNIKIESCKFYNGVGYLFQPNPVMDAFAVVTPTGTIEYIGASCSINATC